VRTILAASLFVSVAACGGPARHVDGPAEPAAVAPPSEQTVEADGTPMEAFTLKDMAGRPFALADHLGRDVLMVSFWATWCAPCKIELELMSGVYDRLADRGFVYVAVSTDGPATLAQVRPYVQGQGYRFPVVLDTQTTVMSRYNPRGDMPFYLLVDRAGRIVDTHQGFTPGQEAEIEARVLELLGASPQ
jgi:peroxiredoxin